ncbi:MAG: antitoxin [Chloroflexota bacterium]|nr:antitoxin [Chloroflexota bacterium]
MKLDKTEQELLNSVEQGEWKNISDLEKEAKRYQEYAKATFRKDRRINIRISEKDLLGIQRKAVAEGIPYQTLISSVLHKFASGRLKDASLTKEGS